VDAAGNMYLNSAVGFVLIRGRKQRPASEHTDASPFTLAGLKVVYALLRTPQLRNAPYRDKGAFARALSGPHPERDASP
jgi:hypothetical protein